MPMPLLEAIGHTRVGTVLSKEERTALSVCSHCGSKQVGVIPVPGGWVELICDDCGETWWYDTARKQIV